jgi:hypothetical protein
MCWRVIAHQIAAAERHVAEARKIVADLTTIIQRLCGLGGDLRDAERAPVSDVRWDWTEAKAEI